MKPSEWSPFVATQWPGNGSITFKTRLFFGIIPKGESVYKKMGVMLYK